MGERCESARGPDADRYAKVLIIIRLEGSNFGAFSQPVCPCAELDPSGIIRASVV
jgi:hypothetical protein